MKSYFILKTLILRRLSVIKNYWWRINNVKFSKTGCPQNH
jgi:hypothetical protein